VEEHAEVKVWRGDTFHQDTIDLSEYDKNIIRAKVEGRWQRFEVRRLPDRFLEWNLKGRIEMIKKVRQGEQPPLAGPHIAIVATHGVRRLDTHFAINNAIKGVGFIPRMERLAEVISLLKSTMKKPIHEKLDILGDLYKGAHEIFDPTKQASLEIYSTPEFETHTFLNEMTDPSVALVFPDLPCFEVKAIAQLLHPKDPQLTDYERDAIEYENIIHDYFHGESSRKSIAVIYHVIEVYDNTPGTPEGMGRRIVP